MTIEKINYYKNLVSDHQINSELIFSCLANLEPRISKYAYLRAKYKNNPLSSEGHDYEMKQLMKYRTSLSDLLVEHYQYPKAAIKQLVLDLDKSRKCSNVICDSVLVLIDSGEFELID